MAKRQLFGAVGGWVIGWKLSAKTGREATFLARLLHKLTLGDCHEEDSSD
jgi:hypothetical protein